MFLNDEEKKQIGNLADAMYQSVANFQWITGGPVVELESLEIQYNVLCEKMEDIRLALSEYKNNETR